MKKILYFLIVVGLVVSSCETMDDPEIEYSPIFPVSGEWWVTCKVNNDDVFDLYYTRLYTYNTSANVANEMVLKTSNSLFAFTAKSGVDVPSRTFSVQNSTNITGGGSAGVKSLSITNGKVIEDGGLSTTGVVVDSIYMEVTLDADASQKLGVSDGTKLVISGVRRTGWNEDDF